MKKLGIKIAFFILGFTLVYVLLGVSLAFVGNFFRANMGWLFSIAGAILIIFGLHVMQVFRIPFLEKTWGGMDKAEEAKGILGSFFVGVAFAVGWSPCTGPILAAILTLAADQGTVLAGGVLLLLYCAGLGIPFMLTGLAVGKFLRLFSRLQKHMRVIEIVSGVLLICLGALFLSQHVNFLRSFTGGALGISLGWESAAAGTVRSGMSLVAMGAALGAGFLSFVSPCVLPLLPSYIAFIAGAEDIDELYA